MSSCSNDRHDIDIAFGHACPTCGCRQLHIILHRDEDCDRGCPEKIACLTPTEITTASVDYGQGNCAHFYKEKEE